MFDRETGRPREGDPTYILRLYCTAILENWTLCHRAVRVLQGAGWMLTTATRASAGGQKRRRSAPTASLCASKAFERLSIKHAAKDGAPFTADLYWMDITVSAGKLPDASIGEYKHKRLL